MKNDPTLSAGSLKGTLTLPKVEEPPASIHSFPEELRKRFLDVKLLGEGGMGIVYQAQDSHLNRPVALKFIRHESAVQQAVLLREAHALARIDHDHVCKVFEIGTCEGRLYLVMQYIEGNTLDSMSDALTLEEKAGVIRDIALGLHEAHCVGLVHRDVKPSNIMVKRAESGEWLSFLMDFGLARDTGHLGATRTGAIAGTPMFMAPEQARGEIRMLDRRTDLYSLGATLYSLIGGKPLFDAPNMGELLMKILGDDPVPLGKINRAVPRDLEIIIMKCLEKEPARRYDSALALARDLDSFLQGEPIVARGASYGYRAWKKARRHWISLSLLLMFCLAVIGFFVNAEVSSRRAEQVATFSREIGEELRAADLFLRNARGLPVHDIEREKKIVEASLLRVQEKIKRIGELGNGPGNYVMGRGYLELGDIQKAQYYLEQAAVAGYERPELHYAYGRVLGILYSRALDELKTIANKKELAEKTEELSQRWRDPALAHLRQSQASSLEEPAYVEGLIAYYDGHFEHSIARAKEAFERSPWLYEAKKLEGDAYMQLGLPFRHDRGQNYDQLISFYGPAEEAYRVAAEIGSSDPEVYMAECELFSHWIWSAMYGGKPVNDLVERGTRRCDLAIKAGPSHGPAKIKRAFFKMFATGALLFGEFDSSRAKAGLDDLMQAAAEAKQAMPDDVMARYVFARAWLTKMQFYYQLGFVRIPGADEAAGAYRRLVEAAPRFVSAQNELGVVFRIMAEMGLMRGEPVAQWADQAIEHLDEAMRLDPDFSYPIDNKATVLWVKAEELLRSGQSPRPFTQRILGSLEDRNTGPLAFNLKLHQSRACLTDAIYESLHGDDSGKSFSCAIAHAEQVEEHMPVTAWTALQKSRVTQAEAEHRLRHGQDAMDLWLKADRLADAAMKASSRIAEVRTVRAMAWAGLLAEQNRTGKAGAEGFNAALSHCDTMISKDPRQETDPVGYVACARIQLERARLLENLRKREDALEALKQAMSMLDAGFSIHSHLADLFVAQGEIYLQRARLEAEPGPKHEQAARAVGAFERAFKENALLKAWQAGVLYEEAKKL